MIALRTRLSCQWNLRTQFTGDSYLQSMMGHGLRASSHAELVDRLASRGFLVFKDPGKIDKVKLVDRARFQVSQTSTYDNSPSKLTKAHCMSTAQLHAQVLSLLGDRLMEGKVSCEIGCGSGYLPAVMAALGCKKVYAVERDSLLKDLARVRLQKTGIHVTSDIGDIRDPLDALYVSPYFASKTGMEEYLKNVPFSDNALVVAVYNDGVASAIPEQQLVLLTRSEDGWNEEKLFRVMCEPLVVDSY